MNKVEVYIPARGDDVLDRARIAKAVTDVFEIAREEMMCGEQETGGVFIIGHHHESDSIVPTATLIGRFTVYGVDGCFHFASEKFYRLHDSSSNDLSAWQSRNVSSNMKRYGGAIVAGDHILSFSGLSEHLDEALVTVAAHLSDLISQREMLEIVQISNNPLTVKLNNAVWDRLRLIGC